jgi:hypothetical protein
MPKSLSPFPSACSQNSSRVSSSLASFVVLHKAIEDENSILLSAMSYQLVTSDCIGIDTSHYELVSYFVKQLHYHLNYDECSAESSTQLD